MRQHKGRKNKVYDHLAHAIGRTITANKSLAVVLGVGPLLAINTLYTVYFYSANALTGHVWILIVPLVAGAFLLTYLHKYTWHALENHKLLHIAIGASATAAFLFVPLIFLTNINLMLFPDKWLVVKGFFSALSLPNVWPRYAHFMLACLALTGLFLVWLFRRADEETIAEIGLPRATLLRTGYAWAFWPTVAQFFVGPVVLLTLPQVGAHSIGTFAVPTLIGAFIAIFAALLMYLELKSPDNRIGGRFWKVAVLILVVIGFMGTGRHLYREAAISPHRALVHQKTLDYQKAVDNAAKNQKPDAQP
jgi:cytochrome c